MINKIPNKKLFQISSHNFFPSVEHLNPIYYKNVFIHFVAINIGQLYHFLQLPSGNGFTGDKDELAVIQHELLFL